MNKGNKLLLGILAFVLVCVVGYAMFSETITVTGSATASGDWGITATCQPGIASEASDSLEGIRLRNEGGYTGDTCEVTGGTKVNLSTNLLYPSAARHFTVKFTNTGNVPATITYNEEMSIFETAIWQSASSEVCEVTDNGQKVNCNETLEYDNGTSNFVIDSIIGFSSASGKFYSVDEVDEFVNEDLGIIALETGESIYLALTLYWSEHYVSNNNAAHLSFNVTGDIEFVQATE